MNGFAFSLVVAALSCDKPWVLVAQLIHAGFSVTWSNLLKSRHSGLSKAELPYTYLCSFLWSLGFTFNSQLQIAAWAWASHLLMVQGESQH